MLAVGVDQFADPDLLLEWPTGAKIAVAVAEDEVVGVPPSKAGRRRFDAPLLSSLVGAQRQRQVEQILLEFPEVVLAPGATMGPQLAGSEPGSGGGLRGLPITRGS